VAELRYLAASGAGLTLLLSTVAGIAAIYYEKVAGTRWHDAAHLSAVSWRHWTAWCEQHRASLTKACVARSSASSREGNADKEAVTRRPRGAAFIR